MPDYNLSQLQAELSGRDWPQFIEWQWNNTSVILQLFIPDNTSWFTGHFPEQAVLPGVVQTHWAAELSKKLFAINGHFVKINNLKFKSVITPQTNLDLCLSYKSNKQLVSFQYQQDEKVFSSGSIEFRNIEFCNNN